MARILVIKLGALGDVIQATGPFAAIRAAHAHDHIVLLTTRPFAALAEASPYFDQVWIDQRPKAWQPLRLLALRRRLRGGGFERVYDLQTSDRSSSYFRLMGGRVEWSGIARGCSHPHANPGRDAMHTLERQAEQLAMAGIAATPPPDLSWAEADLAGLQLPPRVCLLVPGGAPHRPAKRWPAERYGALANRLVAAGLAPVVIGTEADRDQIGALRAACPPAIDLLGRTGLVELAALARRAEAAVGNDTGPMHLIAAAGCPSVVLFSAASDPALCAPRGRVTVLRRDRLDEMPVDAVMAALP